MKYLVISIVTLLMSLADCFTLLSSALIFWWLGPLLFSGSEPRFVVRNGARFSFIYWCWFPIYIIISPVVSPGGRLPLGASDLEFLLGLFVVMMLVSFVVCFLKKLYYRLLGEY